MKIRSLKTYEVGLCQRVGGCFYKGGRRPSKPLLPQRQLTLLTESCYLLVSSTAEVLFCCSESKLQFSIISAATPCLPRAEANKGSWWRFTRPPQSHTNRYKHLAALLISELSEWNKKTRFPCWTISVYKLCALFFCFFRAKLKCDTSDTGCEDKMEAKVLIMMRLSAWKSFLKDSQQI